jgi:hypothetical protein
VAAHALSGRWTSGRSSPGRGAARRSRASSWRICFLACAERFGFRGGREWLVCHLLSIDQQSHAQAGPRARAGYGPPPGPGTLPGAHPEPSRAIGGSVFSPRSWRAESCPGSQPCAPHHDAGRAGPSLRSVGDRLAAARSAGDRLAAARSAGLTVPGLTEMLHEPR